MNIALFKDCCELKTGKLNSNQAVTDGKYPFFTCDPQTMRINSCPYNQEAILLAGNNANGNFNIKYYVGKFDAYQRTYIINSNKPFLITKYLYYYLSTKLKDFTSLATGSATRFLTKAILDKFPITVPTLTEQRHIVDTIGSVDNLIEKNDEIIAKTHEYLDNKFKAFTNDFDKTKIAELDYFNICKSGIKAFDNEKIYLDTASVDQTNIIDESYAITYDNRPSRANMQPTINSVWFAKLKDSPKYILVKEKSNSLLNNFVFSTGFLGLQSEDYLVNYLYCLILSKDFTDQKNLLSNGATMQGINNEIFAEIRVPNITKQQAKDFGKTIEDNVNLILDLKNKNHKLKELKSQLLQKYFG